jgi:hypothetical protein
MPKDTRDKVTLSSDAYKVLEVEAMLMGVSLKDAASKLIIKAACPKCKEILDIMARPAKEPKDTTTQVPNVTIAQEPKDPKAQVPDSPKAKKLRLSKNPEAIAKIKELWNSTPRPSINEIAKTIDYPKATVAENIKKIKDKGDLAN